MKRFSLLLVILISALWMPVLAAHAGEQNGICGERQAVPLFDDQNGISDAKEDLSFDLREQPVIFQEQGKPSSLAQGAIYEKEKHSAPVVDKREQFKIPQNEMASPEKPATPSSPVKEPESLEEPSGENFSFNFLYYLFYKFDISQFFKATGLN